jgi:hypothetical protein
MQAFAFLRVATICHKTRKEAKSCCDPIAQFANPSSKVYRFIVSLGFFAYFRDSFFSNSRQRPPIE